VTDEIRMQELISAGNQIEAGWKRLHARIVEAEVAGQEVPGDFFGEIMKRVLDEADQGKLPGDQKYPYRHLLRLIEQAIAEVDRRFPR
jgi:hypothetical protein